MEKKLFSVLLLFLITVNGISQFKTDYKPVKYGGSTSRLTRTAFFKKNAFKYNTTDKVVISKFNDFLYELHLGYAYSSKKKYFIDEPFMKKYVQSIVDTVLKANQLTEKIQVVITRSAVPNAYNMGDNKLYVNIGILKKLENEAQLAYLLCHELSHQLLFHVQDNFIAAEKRRKDKILKKEIKDINRARYNKLDMTVSLLKTINYDMAKYSRSKEREADSMALILLAKTPYNCLESDGLMNILDHAEKDSTEVIYTKHFESKDFFLEDSWMTAKPKRLDFGDKKIIEFDKDSMKTHPDVPHRMKMLKEQITSLKYTDGNKVEFLQPKTTFDSVVAVSAFEEIEVYNKNKRYAAVVFYALCMLEDRPDNVYLHKQISLGLHTIVKKVKDHTIQNFVPIESKDLPESYNKFLRLIDRTSTEDITTILRNYINNYYPKMSSVAEIKPIYDEVNKKN